MRIGYARFTNNLQDSSTCIDALISAGCQKVVSDSSFTKKNRTELSLLLKSLKKGDTVVVWRMDHLGLPITDLLKQLDLFRQQGIEFVCLANNIDTSTSAGKMVYTFLAGVAETALALQQERAHFARVEAKRIGKKGGRPKGSRVSDSKIQLSVRLRKEGLSVREIAEQLGVSKSTIQRLSSI